tara:strand:+ start:1967 stop:2323 length:357 start_codon:yes stop_codon:yes gene_type:complete
MRALYSLISCNTCKRIQFELNLPQSVTIVNIKVEPITALVLEKMKSLSGSYEALFSKRAQIYKKRNLKERQLSEEEYKTLLLEHYTFLKRPVLIYDENIFIGNSKAVVTAAKKFINEN